MYCRRCGTPNDDNAVFCKNCGELLRKSEIHKPGRRAGKKAGLVIAGIVIVAVIVIFVYMMYGKVQEKRYISNLTDGKKYLAEMDYKKAEESFNEAVSVEPRKIDAYQGLADTYEGLEDYDRMFDSYRKGISIVNQNYKEQGSMTKEGEQFYNNAIDSYVEQGNDEEAKDLIEQMQNMISDEKKKEELEEKKKELGIYRQYYDLLMQYRSKFGEAEIRTLTEYSEYLQGLCFAQLLDFDCDGKEELILAYGIENQDDIYSLAPKYTVEIWAYEKNKLKRIYTGEPYKYNGGMAEIVVAEKEDKYYVITGAADSFEDINVWMYEEDSEMFRITKKLNSEFDMEPSYQIDNQIVSEEQYESEKSKWEQSQERWELYMSRRGEEKTKEKLDDTIQFLESKTGGK
ncbi:zinc-ribbon domain-containing protein [Bariatricus massiliensis]|uniref:Zinc-ribbon domain-containing protein n=1 Tax=Bariatricus massiliensis TaxID=1745713 RepID=A0ABS8DFR8_9FIRM|nr:zinc ribbon domain-containing protein [Bariatricus massiliensis]MCB7303939.1 zinc-ribbon domain-containing protein [Bariatricus massiliensis]MCB7374630.1 zinc-ribbon domain-containing protein [Bariatricus massiliensis]MCB7387049.1 zinc-ribbon domain-containing protein [Bariatricus massiliensis]MCB7411211.1 zinc-ribbon domain-containing protein [Bariatricus massiliensis]MCQ5252845.1 zinc-ribbon domain-containing protein [Bariatricus massiliensis]